MHRARIMAMLMISVVILGFAAPSSGQAPASSAPEHASGIAPYTPRFGRSRPVVAVVGENTFTELTDYVVPYGVLHGSGVADVVALATKAGPIQMFPALKIRPQATVDEFDARFPEGADYVIVPAVHHTEDAALLRWVKGQHAKGAIIVGVCDGVWVVAHAGLLKGRKAVGHWYSFEDLAKKFPETTWVRNRRYLADQRVLTTTGVTASVPVALALVEAMGGHARAAAVARTLGVTDWSATHRSGDFKLRARHIYAAATNWLSFWSHEEVGIPIANGVNEVALSLVADAHSRTYLSNAVSVATSSADVLTRAGLAIVPDRITGDGKTPDRMLQPLDGTRPVAALDAALRDIAEAHGRSTSAFVALQLEYPQP